MADLSLSITIGDDAMDDPRTGSASTLRAVLVDAFWWKFGGDASKINITEANPTGDTPDATDKNNMLKDTVLNFLLRTLEEFTAGIYGGEGIETGLTEAAAQSGNIAGSIS